VGEVWRLPLVNCVLTLYWSNSRGLDLSGGERWNVLPARFMFQDTKIEVVGRHQGMGVLLSSETSPGRLLQTER